MNYDSLYTSDLSINPVHIDDFFSSVNIPTLDTGLAADLEKDFSITEIVAAIKAMQGGKSPGLDGFPTDFFKKFSLQLSPLLMSVFEESFSSKSLPPIM